MDAKNRTIERRDGSGTWYEIRGTETYVDSQVACMLRTYVAKVTYRETFSDGSAVAHVTRKDVS